jgi:hypothetical protein
LRTQISEDQALHVAAGARDRARAQNLISASTRCQTRREVERRTEVSRVALDDRSLRDADAYGEKVRLVRDGSSESDGGEDRCSRITRHDQQLISDLLDDMRSITQRPLRKLTVPGDGRGRFVAAVRLRQRGVPGKVGDDEHEARGLQVVFLSS